MRNEPRIGSNSRERGYRESWQARVLLGSTLEPQSQPEWLHSSYTIFRQHVTDRRYPCFFGTYAEEHGEMFYSYVVGKDMRHLPSTMETFAGFTKQRRFERYNIAVFFEPDVSPLEHAAYRTLFWDTLQYLHDRDRTTSAQHAYDPSDALWEFTFGDVQMFVVCACPSHDARASRNLGPGMILLFQPRSVFVDRVTNKTISEKARQEVRRRLHEWDRVPPHPDLGVYGAPDNREWKQYFLPDEDRPTQGVCPFRSRDVERGQGLVASPDTERVQTQVLWADDESAE